jgi:hypothetical protein
VGERQHQGRQSALFPGLHARGVCSVVSLVLRMATRCGVGFGSTDFSLCGSLVVRKSRPHRLKNLCEKLTTIVGRSRSQQWNVPRLRRSRFYLGTHPALPGWAKFFRASGARSLITNRLRQSRSVAARTTKPERRKRGKICTGKSACATKSHSTLSFCSRRTVSVNRGTLRAGESRLFRPFKPKEIPHFVRNDNPRWFLLNLNNQILVDYVD